MDSPLEITNPLAIQAAETIFHHASRKISELENEVVATVGYLIGPDFGALRLSYDSKPPAGWASISLTNRAYASLLGINLPADSIQERHSWWLGLSGIRLGNLTYPYRTELERILSEIFRLAPFSESPRSVLEYSSACLDRIAQDVPTDSDLITKGGREPTKKRIPLSRILLSEFAKGWQKSASIVELGSGRSVATVSGLNPRSLLSFVFPEDIEVYDPDFSGVLFHETGAYCLIGDDFHFLRATPAYLRIFGISSHSRSLRSRNELIASLPHLSAMETRIRTEISKLVDLRFSQAENISGVTFRKTDEHEVETVKQTGFFRRIRNFDSVVPSMPTLKHPVVFDEFIPVEAVFGPVLNRFFPEGFSLTMAQYRGISIQSGQGMFREQIIGRIDDVLVDPQYFQTFLKGNDGWQFPICQHDVEEFFRIGNEHFDVATYQILLSCFRKMSRRSGNHFSEYESFLAALGTPKERKNLSRTHMDRANLIGKEGVSMAYAYYFAEYGRALSKEFLGGARADVPNAVRTFFQTFFAIEKKEK